MKRSAELPTTGAAWSCLGMKQNQLAPLCQKEKVPRGHHSYAKDKNKTGEVENHCLQIKQLKQVVNRIQMISSTSSTADQTHWAPTLVSPNLSTSFKGLTSSDFSYGSVGSTGLGQMLAPNLPNLLTGELGRGARVKDAICPESC